MKPTQFALRDAIAAIDALPIDEAEKDERVAPLLLQLNAMRIASDLKAKVDRELAREMVRR